MKKRISLILVLCLLLSVMGPVWAGATPEKPDPTPMYAGEAPALDLADPDSQPGSTPTPSGVAPALESDLVKNLEEPKAKAAVVMDALSGEILYDFHGDEHNYPASITKVMTALLVLEAVERGELTLEQEVTVSDTFNLDLEADGSTQGIETAEILTVRDLLYCALVASANEACNILAETVSGSIAAFVTKMNERAGELGMVNTHFVNAHGLHNADHYTSAHDIAIMTRKALENDTFATIVSTRVYTVPETNLHEKRTFGSTNALINSIYSGKYLYNKAIGVKTGTTSAAGTCLVSAGVDQGRKLICVVLGAENETDSEGNLTRTVFVESKRLLEWGFETFATRQLIDPTQPVTEIPVTLSKDVTAVAVKPQEGLEAILPADIDPDALERVTSLYYQELQAPVKAGDVVGELLVRNGEKIYGSVKLVAVASAERSTLLWRIDRIKNFFGNLWVRVILIVMAVAILVLLLRLTLFKPRRRGYSGRRRHR